MKTLIGTLRVLSTLSILTALLGLVPAHAATRYVWPDSPSPMAPYTNWATAAQDIQAAVDAAQAGDTVLVTNGIYATGGRAVYGLVTNRVAVGRPVVVQSVNGPEVTVIQGYRVPGTTNGDGAIRCVYLTNGAVLSGFTLTQGATRTSGDYSLEQSGGGLWCHSTNALVTNCTLTANSASHFGGGAYQGTLNNCKLTNNSATGDGQGGGAFGSTLNNCTLTGNWASGYQGRGGGAFGGALNDCTLAGNSAIGGYARGGGAYSATLNNCTLTGNSATGYYGEGGGAYGGTLADCTLTGNAATGEDARGGGASGATLTNCMLTANSASDSGGGASGSTVNNCTLANNSAESGGGASGAVLRNCTFAGNSASRSGGGAYGGTLTNCTLTANSASDSGGGASGGTLNNCTLTGNSADSGGGASGAVLRNCTLTGNSATGEYARGGGACGGTLANCTLTGNSTLWEGGGTSHSILTNCTVTGNTACGSGGGAAGGTLNNCILYYNTASSGNNYSSSTLNYCCTTPLPDWGAGNISADPQLASLSRLSASSPCRGVGSAAYSTGVDIDGEPWLDPPSIGCDEYRSGTVTGAVTVAIGASRTYVAAGYAVDLVAQISGQVSASTWDLGDGTVVSNRPCAQHAWEAAGDYAVVLRAYNESQPDGVSATVTIRVVAAPVHYVVASSTHPAAPYSSWETAARTIQKAVDAAAVPGALVLVSNGVYATGGRAVDGAMTNRVAVDKPVVVRSVNGPAVTVIQGYQVPGTTNGPGAIRCVYLTNGAVLSGFTLSNGATRRAGDWCRKQSGGGVWCASIDALVTNCTLTGNSASHGGGGAYRGTLNNCTFTANWATNGGGAYQGTLNHCTLTGNSAHSGGGACEGTLNNCMLTRNVAAGGGGAYSSRLYNCRLATNSATGRYGQGGGASGSTLYNCRLTGNSALWAGGGTSESMLNDCTLTGNSAYAFGGGADGGALNNCTLTGNSASSFGGGASGGTLNNCILYYNTANSGNNYWSSTLNHCCTTPLTQGEGNGPGNISMEPQLASLSHLSASSPCRAGGSADYTWGVDIDGEAWLDPPSIGCDEHRAGAVTGAVTVAIGVSHTHVAVGYAVGFVAQISGRVSASAWDFGDGTVVSNRPYARHAWQTPGDHVVALRAYNESHPGGVSGTATIHVVAAPVHYVAPLSTHPVAPYRSWETAARTIQNAVDAATLPGALVLVSNGVYATGGRAVDGTTTNRVVVDKPVVVRSVNGPAVTVIQGHQVPGTTDGQGAIRCVYLTNGAVLNGFTLTNGATRTAGGGVWCVSTDALVTNCTLTGNSAAGSLACGGGAYSGTLDHCTLAGNSATGEYARGGGSYSGTLNHCTLTGNSAAGYYGEGGGAYAATLSHCTLTGNSAITTMGEYARGGGAYDSTLTNCRLTGNAATGRYGQGGGAYSSKLNNCTLTHNVAFLGGGAHQGTLKNCTLTGNSAYYVGGAYDGTLDNCTLTGNSAQSSGGVSGGTLNNCIVYYNTDRSAEANYGSGTFNYCCTTPMPAHGTGNITAEPQLASSSHLSAGSPCRGTGSAQYGTGMDIDGEPWANPPSIGCDEYSAGTASGPLSVGLQAAYTNVAVGFAVAFTGSIEGRASANRWKFGDGTVVSNRLATQHAWTSPADYTVRLTAFNEEHPAGVSATVVVKVVDDVHYVAVGNATPVAPYTSWATAARTIQKAVDMAVPGGRVLVGKGVYASGGKAVYGTITNRVAVDKPVRVESVNGPTVTVIVGSQALGSTNVSSAVRCVYLTNGALLAGFTLTNGATRNSGSEREQRGGGVCCESTDALVTNCILIGNSARNGGGAYSGTLSHCTLTGNSAYYGGGAYDSTLNNCTLTGNSATGDYAYGGGAYSGILNNCTLTGNSVTGSYGYGGGGGASGGTLNTCIVYYNTARYGAANYSSGTFNYCCTTPLPSAGASNITAEPLFVDRLNGNLRLQSNSPCINAGLNAYAPGSTDLDGRPRIVGGTVDIGAYEFQGPGFSQFIPWLAQFGLPTDGSADYTDPDNDGLNNWQEWTADTKPTNALSCLHIVGISPGPPVAISLQTSPARLYTLCHSASATAGPWLPVPGATDIAGSGTIQTLTDPAASTSRFYRVSVRVP